MALLNKLKWLVWGKYWAADSFPGKMNQTWTWTALLTLSAILDLTIKTGKRRRQKLLAVTWILHYLRLSDVNKNFDLCCIGIEYKSDLAVTWISHYLMPSVMWFRCWFKLFLCQTLSQFSRLHFVGMIPMFQSFSRNAADMSTLVRNSS